MVRPIPHQLAVIARAALHAQRRRRPAEPAGAGLEGLRTVLPDATFVEIPGRSARWHDTGIALRAGDRVSTFATGRVYLSRALDVWLGPHIQLWCRVGDGPVFRGTRATNTFTARRDGPLELASYQGGWGDPSGTPPRRRPRLSGSIAVLVVRWAPDAGPEELLGAIDHPLARAELDRLAATVEPPDGWRHLWDVGPAEIFSDAGEAIACRTHADVAILQRDVDVALTSETALRWSWRVDRLPSALAEDTLVTHDYLSIALEFDNGQDLTWHWSAELPVDYAYRCPLPAWKHRETHVVVRSGSAGLGGWHAEERPVARDYAAAVGGPSPARIVRVWLIANSVIQRGEGACTFAGIELTDGDRVLRV